MVFEVSGRPKLNTALTVYYINVVCNVLADILTLALIWFMRRNGTLKVNLYISCVCLMAANQLLYDMSLFLIQPCGVTTQNHACTSFFIGISTCCGIGAALWALMLIVSAAFVVQCRRQPTRRECIVGFTLVNCFMLGWAIPFSIGGYNAHRDLLRHTTLMIMYNDVRLGIIVVTFSVMASLYCKMRSSMLGTSMARSPLYQLTRRLIFYPIVQCVCQVGFFTYAKIYQMSFDAYPEDADVWQTFWLYACVLTAPLAGIGAFLVFLFMKQGAKEQLKRMLTCQCDIAVSASEGSRVSKMATKESIDDDTCDARDIGSVPSEYIDDRDSDARAAELMSAMEEEDLEREVILWEANSQHDHVPQGSSNIKNVPNMPHVDIRISRNPVHDKI